MCLTFGVQYTSGSRLWRNQSQDWNSGTWQGSCPAWMRKSRRCGYTHTAIMNHPQSQTSGSDLANYYWPVRSWTRHSRRRRIHRGERAGSMSADNPNRPEKRRVFFISAMCWIVEHYINWSDVGYQRKLSLVMSERNALFKTLRHLLWTGTVLQRYKIYITIVM